MGFTRKVYMKYDKKYLEKISKWLKQESSDYYLSRHPEIERFDMPKTFYFRYFPEKKQIHWAITKPTQNGTTIYFIHNYGKIFDKIEVKNIKTARRLLRRNGFEFSTNRYCPFTPHEPIYIQLDCGKKSAPYSKGNLWQSVKRDKKHIDKLEKTCFKQIIKFYKTSRKWFYQTKSQTSSDKNYPPVYILDKTIEDSNGCVWLMAILLLLTLTLSLCGF